jgi:hypothetical protein
VRLAGLVGMLLTVAAAARAQPELKPVRALGGPRETADAVAIARLIGRAVKTDFKVDDRWSVALIPSCNAGYSCGSMTAEDREAIHGAFSDESRLRRHEGVSLEYGQTMLSASLPQITSSTGTMLMRVYAATKKGGGILIYSVRKGAGGKWEIVGRRRLVI